MAGEVEPAEGQLLSHKRIEIHVVVEEETPGVVSAHAFGTAGLPLRPIGRRLSLIIQASDKAPGPLGVGNIRLGWSGI